jgi:hypothetical protein
MSYADPQTITINAVAQPMPRTSSGVNTGTFTKDDGTVQLVVSHAYGKRTRRSLRLNHKKIAPDPFVSTQNVSRSASIFLVVDQPTDGYSNAELKQLVDGFAAYLTASSGAAVTNLLGGQQ